MTAERAAAGDRLSLLTFCADGFLGVAPSFVAHELRRRLRQHEPRLDGAVVVPLPTALCWWRVGTLSDCCP
jgi:hypothetical protein